MGQVPTRPAKSAARAVSYGSIHESPRRNFIKDSLSSRGALGNSGISEDASRRQRRTGGLEQLRSATLSLLVSALVVFVVAVAPRRACVSWRPGRRRRDRAPGRSGDRRESKPSHRSEAQPGSETPSAGGAGRAIGRPAARAEGLRRGGSVQDAQVRPFPFDSSRAINTSSRKTPTATAAPLLPAGQREPAHRSRREPGGCRREALGTPTSRTVPAGGHKQAVALDGVGKAVEIINQQRCTLLRLRQCLGDPGRIARQSRCQAVGSLRGVRLPRLGVLGPIEDALS